METWQLLLALLIAFTLGGTLAFIFWKERRRVAAGHSPAKSTREHIPLQLQLQAYERLILLTERIALPNLINRLNRTDLSSRDMQQLLTGTIREEFDHNVTQQIYVSAEAWEAVRNLKEQNIHLIHQVGGILPENSSGQELNKQILEMLVRHPGASLHTVVAEVLSFEAKKILKSA